MKNCQIMIVFLTLLFQIIYSESNNAITSDTGSQNKNVSIKGLYLHMGLNEAIDAVTTIKNKYFLGESDVNIKIDSSTINDDISLAQKNRRSLFRYNITLSNQYGLALISIQLAYDQKVWQINIDQIACRKVFNIIDVTDMEFIELLKSKLVDQYGLSFQKMIPEYDSEVFGYYSIYNKDNIDTIEIVGILNRLERISMNSKTPPLKFFKKAELDYK
jgi:hypothetical protein